MNTSPRKQETIFTSDWGVARLADGALYGLVGCYLLLVLIAYATDLVLAWHLASAAVLLGTVLGSSLAFSFYHGSEHLQSALLSVFGFALMVFAMIYQSSSPGLGLGPNRPLAITVVFVLIISFLLVMSNARQYTLAQWGAVGCFVILTGLYFAHTLSFDPSSSQSRWPIWAAAVMGANLFVVPRLVPDRVFFWFLSRLGALTVVLALLTYFIGEYSIWIFEVRQWSASPPLPGVDTAVQSIFPNPNSFGLLAFAGLIAAVVEFHRSLVDRRFPGLILAAVLASLCGLGVLLSNARASMLAAAAVLVIYTGYVLGGRIIGFLVVGSTISGIFIFLAGMYGGVLDISSANRFELWGASLRAIRDGPMLFGHGSGPANVVIEPYLEADPAPAPHNSYLTVFIQTGVVGGFAYLGLVGGSIVAGMIDYGDINYAMLAFVIGWAIHQMFESYTMFHWSIGSVLVSLSIGFLLFGD